MEITACEPEHLWAERGVSSRGTIDLQLHFAPAGAPDRTRIDVAVDLDLRGLLRWTAPFSSVVLVPLMKADLRRA